MFIMDWMADGASRMSFPITAECMPSGDAVDMCSAGTAGTVMIMAAERTTGMAANTTATTVVTDIAECI